MKNKARPTYLSITITFVAALVFYFVAYNWLTKRQTGKGPWHVVFTNTAAGVPELIISQAQLRLTNVHVRFPGETVPATQSLGTVTFAKPQMATPFGQVVYDDLMFLPGVVTLDCFGHEVELSQRVLVLNRKPVAWASHSTNEVAADARLSPEQRRESKGGYRNNKGL